MPLWDAAYLVFKSRSIPYTCCCTTTSAVKWHTKTYFWWGMESCSRYCPTVRFSNFKVTVTSRGLYLCLAKLHKFRPNNLLQCQRYKMKTGTLLQMSWDCGRLSKFWTKAQHFDITGKVPHSLVLMWKVKPALFFTTLKAAGFPVKQSELPYQLVVLEK